MSTFIRKKSIIFYNGPGKDYPEMKRYPSISAAKKASRALPTGVVSAVPGKPEYPHKQPFQKQAHMEKTK